MTQRSLGKSCSPRRQALGNKGTLCYGGPFCAGQLREASPPGAARGCKVRFQPPGAKPGFAPHCELGDLADLNGPSARRDSADFWFPTHLPKDLESDMLCAWSRHAPSLVLSAVRSRDMGLHDGEVWAGVGTRSAGRVEVLEPVTGGRSLGM